MEYRRNTERRRGLKFGGGRCGGWTIFDNTSTSLAEDMSKVDGESKATQWWLTNETSGRCEIYLASLAIKQSTLVRHAFEVPLYRFVLQWHPLPSHAQVIEFKVLEWDELDPKTLENRGESQNLAGFFTWTINAATGALLTVLSGPLSETRIKKFCSACEEVHMKLSRQEMLALFIDYAQEAAQQVVRTPNFLFGDAFSLFDSIHKTYFSSFV